LGNVQYVQYTIETL